MQRKVVLERLSTALRVLACLAWCAAAFPVAAQVLPARESNAVSDFARVLDATAEARLEQSLVALKEETGVEMAVVTMPRLELYGGRGMRLDDYATALFNAWGIGDAERNDGILMLVLTDTREVRIALGSGYDPVYDLRAARVLSTAVLPEFLEGRLVEGIVAGVASARERLVLPFAQGRVVDVDDGFADSGAGGSLWLFVVGGFVGLFGYMVRRSRRKRRSCPQCAELTLKRTYEVIDPPTHAATGTGMEHLTCANCGFIDRKSYVIARLAPKENPNETATSRADGDGDGGGTSSGGGASGKW